MQFETEDIEFKTQFTEDIYKEIIAFANTDGGVIYIGIDDNGNAVGIKNVDETYTRITNGIRDAIAPDVTMFIKYTIQDNLVVQISVGEGPYKPYYLKSKGLKPSGVYVRQGTSAAQASPEQIQAMIKDSDGDVFETMRSMEQKLTFEEASSAFASYGVDFSENKYRALGITLPSENIFTNLPNMNAFSREIENSITPQMQAILSYIKENGSITDLHIQELLEFKKTRAFNLAKQMRKWS